MYKLYVVDKDNKKIKIFESKSESGMDSFTSHFDSKDDLLNQIGLDSKLYKIQVEKLLKEEDNGEEVSFINSKYNNVGSLYSNKGNERTLIEYSSKEVDLLREFFLNELLRFPLEKDLNEYDKNRANILDRIIYTYDTYDKGNDKDISSLYTNMRAYFNENYSSLKALYMYLINRGKDVTELINDSGTINFDNEIKRIKKLVQSKGISKNGNFIDESLPKKETIIIDEDDDVENLLDKEIDSDILYKELDMILDSKKLTAEEKNKIKENNKNRL